MDHFCRFFIFIACFIICHGSDILTDEEWLVAKNDIEPLANVLLTNFELMNRQP